MKPYLEDADFTLLNADVLEGLASLPDESVHCVVTSPPYWGLRDYGTGLWEGGDPECDHVNPSSNRTQNLDKLGERYSGGGHKASSEGAVVLTYRDECGKCGARRVDNQLGLEPTPEEYVARMVEVFRDVRRVLRSDGTCWLNLGDSYSHSGNGSRDPERWPKQSRNDHRVEHRNRAGAKPKDLCGIPWRVAFALQADGWYLRSDIIWSKPNPMPESVTDRPTKAHEYVFLLSKSARYFYDATAIAEPAAWERWGDQTVGPGSNPNGWIKPKGKNELTGDRRKVGFNDRWDVSEADGSAPRLRNARSVWEIATQPYPDAHFATYPEELVRRAILAGTSERGCCPVCGKPWEREVERVHYGSRAGDGDAAVEGFTRNRMGGQKFYDTEYVAPQTLGWRSSCGCSRPDIVPATILDPFLGSGTTSFVARKHGRRSIGVELSPEYCELAARRLQQQSLFAGASA